jgi:hypothetical protein
MRGHRGALIAFAYFMRRWIIRRTLNRAAQRAFATIARFDHRVHALAFVASSSLIAIARELR